MTDAEALAAGSRGRRRVRRGRRRGSFLVLAVAGLVFFMGLMALVADVGITYSRRLELLGVVDSAVLATLMTVQPLDTSSAEESLRQLLQANGFAPDRVLASVTVTEAEGSPRLEVVARDAQPAIFAMVFGRRSFEFVVRVGGAYTPPPEPPPASGAYDWSLFSCNDAYIASNFYLDSYDSRLGVYDPYQNSMDNAELGARLDLDFNLSGSAALMGTAFSLEGHVTGSTAGSDSVSVSVESNLSEDGDPIGDRVSSATPRVYEAERPPMPCSEEEVFPAAFLEQGSGDHSHQGGAARYTPKRPVEDPAAGPPGGGDDTLEIDGVSYQLGNRFNSGAELDQLFIDNPINAAAGKYYCALNACLASDPDSLPPNIRQTGGLGEAANDWTFIVAEADACKLHPGDSQNSPVLRTGHVYFFHEFFLLGGQVVRIDGDYMKEGPAVIVVHGNGQEEGDYDVRVLGSARFDYIGLCDGSLCPSPQVPAVRFYLTDGSVMEWSANSEFIVDVYGPGAELHLQGGTELFGRALVGYIETRGNATFHFDESIYDSGTVVDDPLGPALPPVVWLTQ